MHLTFTETISIHLICSSFLYDDLFDIRRMSQDTVQTTKMKGLLFRDRPSTMAGDGAECIFLIHVNFSYPYKLFIKFFIPLQKVLEIFHTPTYGPQYSSTTCSLIRIRCLSSIPPCPLRVRLFYFKCNLYAGNSTVYINTMQD